MSVKTYQLSSIKQLIDLNGDITNFDLTFSVNSKGGEPFDALVVDQTTLDNNTTIDYKQCSEGTISGNIVADKNVYQNYFLILRAEKPCECDVNIDIKEIPPRMEEENIGSGGVVGASDEERNAAAGAMMMASQGRGGSFNWNVLAIVAVVAAGIFYYLYSSSSSSKGESDESGDGGNGEGEKPALIDESITSPPVPQAPTPPSAPTPPVAPVAPVAPPSSFSSSSSSSSSDKPSLMDRINAIGLD